ncbi:MAG: hypothetical protein ACYCUI_07100 [Vulcanimicrobiaceae bacterium]
MQDKQSAPAATPARGLFTPEQETFLLSQAVGQPSGIVVDIGGVSFDLVPLSTEDGLYVTGVITKFTALWAQINGASGAANESDVLATLERDVPRVFGIMHTTLHEAATVAGGAFDEAVFERWFAKTRLIPLLRALVPAVLKCNGFEQFAERLEQANARPPKPAPMPARKHRR